MKKIKLLFTLFLWLTISIHAQVPPNAFNYSAVARDAAGEPIATTTIGIQVSILQSSTIGSAIYVENHFVNTDDFGLFNLIIGAGAAQIGTMENIAWDTDNFYLQIGMDANGGTNFLTMGTTQFLSVPYALHAATADSLIGGEPSFSGGYNDLINQPITVDSLSTNNDTIYLSNGETFITGGGSGGIDILALPTITTNTVIDITSNSATFGGEISNANENQIIERGIVYSTSPNPNIALSDNIIIGNGIGDFDTISGIGYHLQYDHTLNPNTTYYVRAYAITENNISAYGNEVSFTTLSVGQTGPGGGIVFFDKGNANGGWQYLESATSDQSTALVWGCVETTVPGTQLTVGSGAANTSLIVATCIDANFAAKLCNDLTLGGQSDWFLPSRAELYLMWKNLHQNGLGNFNTFGYWSSTENGYYSAWRFRFADGYALSKPKHYSYCVRAVRAF